ncbi:DEAD/DEAH box helicase [Lysinibacillus fusiformis]|uniref:DEAD/DEAH box helicase n=1 Tax=Lysinibacillus fusiformis TaxID=28031 RepID=UPI003CFF14CD
MSKFENVQLFIEGNDYLREPQIEAYHKIEQYFNTSVEGRKEALVVLPTGTGKTGVMAIAPFAVSKSKVLVITPQTVVANTVMGSLDSLDYKNFWYSSNTINDISNLPSVVHYNKEVTKGTLDLADIIVVNIHKLQERLESSLLRKVENDFFDFIIIDEAHHSEAQTWKKTVEYFKNAHILKLTGTPFRSDGVIISGETIYSYPLSKAMANGYVKSLERFKYSPDKMFFTLDGESKQYSLEELRGLKLKDNEWISRKVALSEESNLGVIRTSIEKLKIKRSKTSNPHKIVAVACSIEHANQLKNLYENEGLEVALVHSDMDKVDLAGEFTKIDTHKVDVVINVALLGEGYDHKFLSIAAIFRPFRSDLPYQQFIGRVLRSISHADTSNISPDDNIAEVIVHEELGLEPLWEAYKKEIIKKGIITEIRKEKKLNPRGKNSADDSASVLESNEYTMEGDTFINTKLLEERKLREAEEQNKIKAIMEMLDVSPEEAKRIVLSTKTKDSVHLLRPDLAQANLRKEIDNKIREEIIPELLANNTLDLKGDELYNMRNYIFPLWMNSLPVSIKENGGVLGYYFNTELRKKIGVGRKDWEIEDYHIALDHLNRVLPFIAQKIEANCQ